MFVEFLLSVILSILHVYSIDVTDLYVDLVYVACLHSMFTVSNALYMTNLNIDMLYLLVVILKVFIIWRYVRFTTLFT